VPILSIAFSFQTAPTILLSFVAISNALGSFSFFNFSQEKIKIINTASRLFYMPWKFLLLLFAIFFH